MEDRPYILVAVLVLMLVVGTVLAYTFSGQQRSPVTKSAATKTFRAKEGTQRSSGKALVKNREYAPAKKGTSTKPIEVWGRFDDEGGASKSGNEEANSKRLAEEVLEDLTLAEGVAVLEVELQLTEAPAEIYAALGALYAEDEPYDEERVEGAFALALSTARTPEERLGAIYRQAKVYVNHRSPQAVLDLLNRTQPGVAVLTPRSAEIEVMRANALAQLGDRVRAVQALKGVFEHEDARALLADEDFEPVYRNVALRLVRLYREMGDEESAKRVGQTLKARLRE